MRILVVDDSKAMRMIIIRTLRQAGYAGHEVEQATNGAEALEAVEDARPDLILCDWNMPEMSGMDLLHSLRARGDQVPFGFVTSEGSEEMRDLAREAGAQFLLAKPFNADSLSEALESVLA